MEETWVDRSQLARRCGVQPATVSSWLTNERPAWHPLPQPTRFRGMRFPMWPESQIGPWIKKYLRGPEMI